MIFLFLLLLLYVYYRRMLYARRRRNQNPDTCRFRGLNTGVINVHADGRDSDPTAAARQATIRCTTALTR